jgi:DNA-binding MarR family transcriptional regulator
MTEAVFFALADANRRAILERLTERPQAVLELAAQLPVSRSAVSQHLKILRDAGLVSETRRGKFAVYRAETDALQSIEDWLATLRAWPNPAAVPSAHQRQGGLIGRATQLEEEELLNAELARWETLWPGIDPLQSALRAWIRGVSQILEKSSAALGGRFGINLTDISILGVLQRIGPPHESTPTNLSRISLTSMPGMTRRLDHLERRGLITRLPSADDRRSRVVRLSAAGSALMHDYMRAQFSSALESAFALPPEELRMLAASMRRLLLRLRECTDNADGAGSVDNPIETY